MLPKLRLHNENKRIEGDTYWLLTDIQLPETLNVAVQNYCHKFENEPFDIECSMRVSVKERQR